MVAGGVFYAVILEREEDGGYHAFYPILKGCHTQGNTLANVREAIEAYLDSLRGHDEHANRIIPAD